MPANLENSAVATGLEKVSFHSNPKEQQCQRMFKLLHNCTHLTLWQSNAQNSPSQDSTVHEPWNSDVQAGFRNGRGNRDQIANIHWVIEKAREFRKTSTSASLIMLRPLTMWITINCGKFLKRWEYQTTLLVSRETCIQDKKQQLELDMKQRTVLNWERSMSNLCIVTLLI